MSKFHKGTTVAWNWGSGKGRGTVTEVFTRDVERTIEGTKVKRKANEEEPAYLLKQEDGGQVLKSQSELEAVR